MAGRPHIFVLYIYMVAMILGGAGNGVATKIVDKTEFNDKPFHHPYFQSFAMFVAESLCIFAYLYELWDAKKKYGNYELSPDVIEAKRRGKSTKINPLKFIFPMLCDAVGSTLQLFAYLYIQVSAAQMIQGCIVLVTAFQSVLFLRKRLHRHHWTGLFFVVLGIALVGLAVMISGSDSIYNHYYCDRDDSSN